MIKCAHIRSKIFPRFSNSLQCRIYKTGTINFYTFICLSLLAAVQNETNSLINKSEIVLYKNKNEKLISSRKMEPKSPELISIRTGVKKPSDTDKAQISINEFLNFLKTAYQVQDSVEGILLEGGMNEAVNWLKSKELEFAQKGKNMSAQTSEAFLQQSANKTEEMLKKDDSFSNLNSNSEALKEKLNEVLSEGLLDSVLPYLVQNSQSLKKISSSCIISNKTADKTLNSLGATSISNEKIARKKSSGDASCSTGKSVVTKSESEVEIHVCDEMKNTKKTFVCNQKLLVEKMGYFAEVTLGQKLEDMDISVHCDIGIFEWLMQWVKKDDVLDEWPQLDSQCVIPILVSAAFLQMEPLLQDCLLYCHGHMNEILRSASNLSCLNDSVLTRLAAMYTNTEIESIKDRKDKIQSRLFTKMIQSLTEPDPESVRGHWCSLARIFRCEKCEQLLTPNVATKIPCIPTCMRLQPDGTIISLHFRDSTSWNINTYIRKLQKTLKTWRKVYWRLWGDVHFLYCVICKKYFSANRIGWCQYHPDSPQFFTLDAQKAALPIGRYPCCGERAYRFQLLQNQSGCQFRQHTVSVEDVRHSAIYAMLENYRDLIEEEPPELLFPERLTRLVARGIYYLFSKNLISFDLNTMELSGFSYDRFLHCIKEILTISDNLLDGWKLNNSNNTGIDNGKYLTKKIVKNLKNNDSSSSDTYLVTFEYHIVYHLNYGVPVLCLNIFKSDGSLLTMEDYWKLNENLQQNSIMYESLTQLDHPVLCRPFLMLHPCKTLEILQPFLAKSSNPIISWLSIVGSFVHLEILEEYFKHL